MPPNNDQPVPKDLNQKADPQPSQPIPQQPYFAADNTQKPSKRKIPKKLVLIAALLVFLMGGSAAAYFGFVVPNNPEKVWAKAFENTAKGYDELVSYAQEQKDTKGADIKGSVKVDGDFATDGTFESSWFEGTGTIKANLGLGTTRANLETRFIKSATTTPDIYLNVSGIKGLGQQYGEPELEETIKTIDGQWIFIDHTLIDNLQKQALSQTGANPASSQLTPEDTVAISNKVGEALKEYVFTDNPSKAVFTVKQAVGAEKRDGRDMYHYKVGVDKQHLKDFSASLKDKLNQTKIKELLGDKSLEDAINYEDLLKDIDKIDTNKAVADVWVDKKTKLFHVVRITDEKSADNYVEFGTPYTGGDEYPFVIKFASKEESSNGTGNIRLTINKKTDTAVLSMDVEGKEEKSTTKFGMQLNVVPRSQAFNVEKPAGAKPLAEVMGPFAPLLQGGGIQQTPQPDNQDPDQI